MVVVFYSTACIIKKKYYFTVICFAHIWFYGKMWLGHVFKSQIKYHDEEPVETTASPNYRQWVRYKLTVVCVNTFHHTMCVCCWNLAWGTVFPQAPADSKIMVKTTERKPPAGIACQSDKEEYKNMLSIATAELVKIEMPRQCWHKPYFRLMQVRS